ncbi:hypothetical protein HPB51_023460 [Rhipicephalus microplus]|uniref:GH18 domain-containing protein n=1 Tax=Rhipicephalus microplus TaxID=6941 RepID=A0A9J6F6D6_RHIMP|nr:hypothetical protein HPB51_023460 [Rhipicephalus microplus]
MIMRDAVVEGSANFDHLEFFNMHPNVGTRAYNISASIENAAAAAGIRTRDLRTSDKQCEERSLVLKLNQCVRLLNKTVELILEDKDNKLNICRASDTFLLCVNEAVSETACREDSEVMFYVSHFAEKILRHHKWSCDQSGAPSNRPRLENLRQKMDFQGSGNLTAVRPLNGMGPTGLVPADNMCNFEAPERPTGICPSPGLFPSIRSSPHANGYWRDEEQYHAENIPLSYCTDVVFGTRTLYNNYTPEAKGSESSYRLQRMPITILQIGGKLRHRPRNLILTAAAETSKETKMLQAHVLRLDCKLRGQRISVYEAIGGERRDSHNFSTFLSRDASRLLIADFYTTGRKNTLQGVYIDWLHPGDNCGGPNDTDNMISFIHNLRALNLSVILAIPPEPVVVSSYDLPRAMPLVTYLVVKTHTLRLSGAVYCSGSRRYAAHIFSTVRDLLPWKQRHKLAYSISTHEPESQPA